jgi:hypothetical protein
MAEIITKKQLDEKLTDIIWKAQKRTYYSPLY